MRTVRRFLFPAAIATMTLLVVGCYEDAGGSAPQAQTPAATPKEGPITSMGNQPASSALGKAKRTAGNIVDQAEQKSREVAGQADEMMNPKPSTPPSDDPANNPGR